MNRVELIGRLSRNPDVRQSNTPTQSGEPMTVARFTLCVDRGGTDRDGNRQTDFIDCVAFGKKAEFCEKYLSQGTKIAICGRITTSNYTNKDGQKVYAYAVTCDEIEFCEPKASNEQRQQQAPQGGYQRQQGGYQAQPQYQQAPPQQPRYQQAPQPAPQQPPVNEGFMQPSDDPDGLPFH